MKSPFAWWRERRARRAAQDEDDAYRARVCALTMQACEVWQMPCVFVDQRGARIVDHPATGPAATVIEFGWPDALERLEQYVRERVAAERVRGKAL